MQLLQDYHHQSAGLYCALRVQPVDTRCVQTERIEGIEAVGAASICSHNTSFPSSLP